MKQISSFLLFAFLNVSCTGQCHSELKKYAFGFEDIASSSFTFLDKSLEDVRILGFGEDTHGTAEFTILADELMKYDGYA